MTVRALAVHAGPRALAHLAAHGLRPDDIRAMPGAAGGPKGLVLNPLDRFIFGDWLPTTHHTVHLLGASIGAWRMACACLPDPAAALARMADDYIRMEYRHEPGRMPVPSHVTEVFTRALNAHFDGHDEAVLRHPRYRLHVFTTRGRHVLSREGRVRTPIGYLGAFVANAISRSSMSGFLERVVFSDPRDRLPMRLTDYRTHVSILDESNLRPSILASCSIPFALSAVHDIPGGPRGAYWDGGITDYHLHLDYASMIDGLVLYPHFQQSVIPGWLDKSFKRRHRATALLDNLIVISPRGEWVKTLPNGKLPDRADFKSYAHDLPARRRAWHTAVSESDRLRDEFAAWTEGRLDVAVQPLM